MLRARFDRLTHFCGHPEPLVKTFCISRKLPGVTGEVFGAAMEAGRASNTAPSSSESKPSTLEPRDFSRATTPGTFRDGVDGGVRRGDKARKNTEERETQQRPYRLLAIAILPLGSPKIPK